MATIEPSKQALEDAAMKSLMMTLQQPLSVAALVQCLGLGARRPSALCARRRQRQREQARLNKWLPAVLEQPLLDDDEAVPACGWFNSSHELHQGLEVREHAGVEGLGAELPVTIWLGLALGAAADPPAIEEPLALALKA
jgi:hypothetical protein